MSHGELMQNCIVVNSLLEPYYLIIYKVAKEDLKIAAPSNVSTFLRPDFAFL